MNSPPLDRLAPAFRPPGRVAGYHHWSDLLFVHWRFPAQAVRPLLPDGLTLDTWDGDAWIGLVPFRMSGVRPWWSPPIPGVSSFCETNVRTYVHHQGRNPGVWFFSLEASQSLAVRVARRLWHLPYHRASMSLERAAPEIRYASRRLWPGEPGPGCRIEATVGPPWGLDAESESRATSHAVPGTLEHWLIERYILYARGADGSLRMGRVSHARYPLRQVTVRRLEQTLLPAAGLATDSEPCHAIFSEGVDVEVFPLTRVG